MEQLMVIPLQDRVVLVRDDDATSAGVIVIPDKAQKRANVGTVLAVGPGKREDGHLVPMTVQPGDKVAFGDWAGTEVMRDGKELLIVREGELHGILTSTA